MHTDHKKTRVYLIGGGIASLASAAYCIKDGHIRGDHITIFEESPTLGGALDAQGSPTTGYVMRGYRMLEDKIYSCTYDLLSFIPGRNHKTLKQELLAFNKKTKTHSTSRLIANGTIIDAGPLGLHWKDRSHIFELMALSEPSLKASRIQDFFTPSFFTSDFWIEFSTTFGFRSEYSLAELRRYFLRFIQEPPEISTLSGVRSTVYNQYDSIIAPLVAWLKGKGVHFETSCTVQKITFTKNSKTVTRLTYTKGGERTTITVNPTDQVLFTAGSMVSNSSFGSMTSSPKLDSRTPWPLWNSIAKLNRDFGKPTVFTAHVNKSRLISFTITSKNPLFFKLVETLTKRKAGEQGLITFKDSHWLLSVVLPQQPHFANQPTSVTVCWGYGLYPEKKGNFVQKKMLDCTGTDLLMELCGHLGFEQYIPKILRSSICIPCLMPYGTSQFLPRRKGDRPAVVPPGSTNFAFIGQYCEIPDDIVFTIEYSVRSAQIAVYSLLGLPKKVTPIYKGQHNIKILYDAFKASLR